MNSNLLIETKRKIVELNRKNGGRVPYPQFVKDAVAELSKKMSASQIANELGLSKTFACKIARATRLGENSIKKKETDKGSLMSTKGQQLQFLDVTDNLKSFMKEDNNCMPIMKFTTKSGTVIEIFS